MKRNVFFTSALALSLTLLIGAATFAEARGFRDGDCYRGDRGAYSELTQEQRESMGKIYEQHEKNMTEVRTKMRQLDAELYAESTKESPDSKKIVQLSQEIGALKGQMHNDRIALNKDLAAKNLPHGMGRGMGRGGNHGGGNHGGGNHGGGYHGDDNGRHDRGYGKHGGRGHSW